nr:MAG TPA: hypothetical protein [Caudoviricetes sp.]
MKSFYVKSLYYSVFGRRCLRQNYDTTNCLQRIPTKICKKIRKLIDFSYQWSRLYLSHLE